MSNENPLLRGAHLHKERMLRQTMKPRYIRKAHFPDTMPYGELINCMPFFYRERVKETGLELVAIENDLPWCDRDVTLFALGPSDPHLIGDLQPSERDRFFSANRRIIDRALVMPDCVEAYVGIGFNPEDDAYGCHTIKRLHAHVCCLDEEYLRSRQPATSSDRRDPYYRMVYFEPFTPVFADFIKGFSDNNSSTIRPKLHSLDTNAEGSLISLKYPRQLFATPQMNLHLCDMLADLSSQYSKLEQVYTDRVVDPTTNRFLPLDKDEIRKRLDSYLGETSLLSQQSIALLEYLAQHITRAEPRKKPTSIENARQLWMSKGFSGAYIFRFWPDDPDFAVEFYPKWFATQALTRGNGVNSGACTNKDNTNPETDPHLIAKMDQYIEMAKSALCEPLNDTL